MILVKLLDGRVLATALGAAGIVLLSISRHWKFRPGAFAAILLLLVMALLFNWKWADEYFPLLLNGTLPEQPAMIRNGILNSLIPLIFIRVFLFQLSSIHSHSSKKWFEKKISVVFFRLILYFQFFLLIYFLVALLLIAIHGRTGLSLTDSNMIASSVALLAAGIPAILFIVRGVPGSKNKHRRHHRRPPSQG